MRNSLRPSDGPSLVARPICQLGLSTIQDGAIFRAAKPAVLYHFYSCFTPKTRETADFSCRESGSSLWIYRVVPGWAGSWCDGDLGGGVGRASTHSEVRRSLDIADAVAALVSLRPHPNVDRLVRRVEINFDRSAVALCSVFHVLAGSPPLVVDGAPWTSALSWPTTCS